MSAIGLERRFDATQRYVRSLFRDLAALIGRSAVQVETIGSGLGFKPVRRSYSISSKGGPEPRGIRCTVLRLTDAHYVRGVATARNRERSSSHPARRVPQSLMGMQISAKAEFPKVH